MSKSNLPVLTLSAATFILAACGPQESNSSGNTQTSVSGTVADGYLVGATVCLDTNQNRRCDIGEPSTISTAGGLYSFDADADIVDQYPIVVVADTNTIDEDTGEPLTKPLIMSAPAGEPAFVSPLTTIVQTQLELNPAMSIEEAETSVLTQMGVPTDGSVSLFQDYIAQDTDTNEVLHVTAQIVAKGIADTLESVESLEASGEITASSEDIMTLVVQQVSASLDEIALTANTLVATATEEDPITVEDIAAATTQTVTTTVTAEDANTQLAENTDAKTATSENLYEWISANGYMNFAITVESPYLRYWSGANDPVDNYLNWRDFGYEATEGGFIEIPSDYIPDNRRNILTEDGEIVTLIENETSEEWQIRIIDNGDKTISWQTFGYPENNTTDLYLHDEYLIGSSIVDVSGRNIQETIDLYFHSEAGTEGLIDQTSTFPEGSKIARLSAGFSNPDIMHIHEWTDCEPEKLAAIEAANPGQAPNCNTVDQVYSDEYYFSALTDFFTGSAYIPLNDPLLDGRNITENKATTLVYSGEATSLSYTGYDWDSGEDRIENGRIVVELVGNPEISSSGDVNYYALSWPKEYSVPFSNWCTPNGEDPYPEYYALTGDNCEVVELGWNPDHETLEDRMPASFSDLLTPEAALQIGESRFGYDMPSGTSLLWHTHDITFEPIEITEESGDVWDYYRGYELEIIGSGSDQSGTVAIYHTNLKNSLVPHFWECGDDPNASTYNNNCNVAVITNFESEERALNISEAFNESLPVLFEGIASSQLAGYSFVGDLSTWSSMSANANQNCMEQDGLTGDRLWVIPAGDPTADSGSAQLLRTYYFDYSPNNDGTDCQWHILPDAIVSWTRETINDQTAFYLDLSQQLQSDELSEENSNPFNWYIAIDTDGIPRLAEKRINEDEFTRLDANGTWEIATFKGKTALIAQIPDSLTPSTKEPARYIEDSGRIRKYELQTNPQIEPLNVNKTWAKTTYGTTDVISWPTPGLIGEQIWTKEMILDGNVVRQIERPAELYEKYGWWSWNDTLVNSVTMDAIKQQVIDNYSTWSVQ